MINKDTITIDKKRYFNLLCAERKLEMLDSGGVDDWHWYVDALNPDNGESYSDYCDALEIELGLVEESELDD